MTNTIIMLLLGLFVLFDLIMVAIVLFLLRKNNIDLYTFKDFLRNGKSYKHCETCEWFCNDVDCSNRNCYFDSKKLEAKLEAINKKKYNNQ